MKKSIFLLIISSNLAVLCSAQASKWFVSLTSGPVWGGPGGSIKRQMVKQGFDDQSHFIFLGADFTSDYPKKSNGASFMIRGGKKQKENRSIYFAAGIADKGSVRGYKSKGTFSSWWLFGGTDGNQITIDYDVYSIGAGYQYSFPKTRSKLGLGPTAFLFNYQMQTNHQETVKKSSIIPGASFNARVPLGREKKLFGVELFANANLALPAKMKQLQTSGTSSEATFNSCRVNMIHATAGLAFSFRR